MNKMNHFLPQTHIHFFASCTACVLQALGAGGAFVNQRLEEGEGCALIVRHPVLSECTGQEIIVDRPRLLPKCKAKLR